MRKLRTIFIFLSIAIVQTSGAEIVDTSALNSSELATSGTGNKLICDSGKTAFVEHLLPVLTNEERCITCHGPDSPIAESPYFLRANIDLTYRLVTRYMNFDDLASSKLVVQSGNDHCQFPNCDAVAGAEVAEAVAAWWTQGESECHL